MTPTKQTLRQMAKLKAALEATIAAQDSRSSVVGRRSSVVGRRSNDDGERRQYRPLGRRNALPEGQLASASDAAREAKR